MDTGCTGAPSEQVYDLRSVTKKVVDLIFLCEQALAVNNIIAEKAGQINSRNLGNFFAPVQYAFFQTFALDICKIFEHPKRIYSLHSIPSALKLLSDFDLKYPQHLASFMIEQNLLHILDSSLEDEVLVKRYVSEITKRLTSHDITDKLARFRTIRHKWVAHSEACVLDIAMNLQDASYLLKFAKKFVTTVGLCFLDITYEDAQGEYMLDSYEQRASRATRKVLECMGIVALENMDDEVRARMIAGMIQKAEWSETAKQRVREILFEGA